MPSSLLPVFEAQADFFSGDLMDRITQLGMGAGQEGKALHRVPPHPCSPQLPWEFVWAASMTLLPGMLQGGKCPGPMLTKHLPWVCRVGSHATSPGFAGSGALPLRDPVQADMWAPCSTVNKNLKTDSRTKTGCGLGTWGAGLGQSLNTPQKMQMVMYLSCKNEALA